MLDRVRGCSALAVKELRAGGSRVDHVPRGNAQRPDQLTGPRAVCGSHHIDQSLTRTSAHRQIRSSFVTRPPSRCRNRLRARVKAGFPAQAGADRVFVNPRCPGWPIRWGRLTKLRRNPRCWRQMRETLRMEGHISLALGLHARPGSVAVLLGAGASASAGILTAWQVRQELIRQVARAKGDGEVSDAEAWWAAQPDVEATGYGDLLASLAPTAAGRRDLLRQFFEPTEDEREVGLKQPGVAHRALARLVRTGAVKIVLTLNFDRLAENAIREAGVEPVVLSSPDAIAGSDPLQHQEALVVHLHGDYLSPETLNTPAELETYDVRMRSFLDEVFDRYGLLVVGWSAKWDAALRARLQASRTRRYGTWCVDALALGEHARDLAVSRDASVSVREAGSYLAATADAVSALADQRLADPVAPGLAVAYAKRALVGPGTAVPLHDNVRRELDSVAALEPLTNH